MVIPSNTRFHASKRMGAGVALALGLLTFHAAPAAAQQFTQLRSWGQNDYGQVGCGETKGFEASPRNVFAPPAVAQISTSGYHALMLGDDGSVWAWGNNGSGELGANVGSIGEFPVQVQGLTGAIYTSAGGFSLAVRNDGKVFSWGNNYFGTLGNGVTDSNPHYTPSQVQRYGDPAPPLDHITEAVAGGAHGVALASNGYIWTWGANYAGQLGLGDNADRYHATPLFGLPNVTDIAAGDAYTLALRSDYTVWAWGQNNFGQLGDGTATNRNTPVQVVGLNNVVAIAASRYISAALKSDGTVWFWGSFYGLTNNAPALTPQQMPGLSNIRSIAVGQAHLLAADNAGYLWAVGDNEQGQLGDPSFGAYAYPARQVKGLYSVLRVAAGGSVSLIQTLAANLAGNIHLEGISDYAPNQNITLVFQANGQDPITKTVTASSDAFFQVQDLPRNNYTVSIKGDKWLRRTVSVSLAYSDVSAFDVTLPAGDANNDNRVDIADFGIFINAYSGDINVPGSGYDVRADFNCDGSVDIADFGLLVNNYGSVGDM